MGTGSSLQLKETTVLETENTGFNPDTFTSGYGNQGQRKWPLWASTLDCINREYHHQCLQLMSKMVYFKATYTTECESTY